jgi:hypothetical protein
MPMRNMLALKPLCMLSRDVPTNVAQSEGEPLQSAVDLDPLPRFT